MSGRSSEIDAVALLSEPARRRLYEWVVAQRRAVSRDEAARATGLSRALAAFHLDRLARAGLLEVEFRRLSGRSGPGAGRPAKLYRRSAADVSVSVPSRSYETAAQLFAESLERKPDGGPPGRLRKAARRRGREWSVGAGRGQLLDVLADHGYEPVVEGDEIRLRNCPFHALVADHRELVCGMNLALTEGLLEGLGESGVRARLAPEPGYCCVRIERATADE